MKKNWTLIIIAGAALAVWALRKKVVKGPLSSDKALSSASLIPLGGGDVTDLKEPVDVQLSSPDTPVLRPGVEDDLLSIFHGIFRSELSDEGKLIRLDDLAGDYKSLGLDVPEDMLIYIEDLQNRGGQKDIVPDSPTVLSSGGNAPVLPGSESSITADLSGTQPKPESQVTGVTLPPAPVVPLVAPAPVQSIDEILYDKFDAIISSSKTRDQMYDDLMSLLSEYSSNRLTPPSRLLLEINVLRDEIDSAARQKVLDDLSMEYQNITRSGDTLSNTVSALRNLLDKYDRQNLPAPVRVVKTFDDLSSRLEANQQMEAINATIRQNTSSVSSPAPVTVVSSCGIPQSALVDQWNSQKGSLPPYVLGDYARSLADQFSQCGYSLPADLKAAAGL